MTENAQANPETNGHAGDFLLQTRNLKMHFPIRTGLLQRTVGAGRRSGSSANPAVVRAR